MFFGQNSGGNSFFMKMLEDFDDSLQNKTSKCIEMCILLWTLYQSDSTSFWFKICEEKNCTIARRFAIKEHELLHYCETLL